MRILFRSKFCFILSFILLLSIIPLTSNVIGDPSDYTTVSILPASQSYDSGDSFTVDVYCVPTQPIKAYEFRLSFDASLLTANSVTEGDIFENHTTLFNSGTIDNSAGTIIDVYGLIIGSNNTTDPGTLVSIDFTAKSTSGTSNLQFSNIGSWTGVTNETSYVPVIFNSGSVTVQGENGGSGSPPSPPGSPPPFPIPPAEENNPPAQPLKPSGATFVEMDIEYDYSSSTFDVDGEQIRYKFDWGDGTYSEWSDYLDSNISVSMNHYWSEISVYEVRVIAQDTEGLNSSWSPALNITVSQVDLGAPPVVTFNLSGNVSINETIMFDASGSFDTDGVIIAYEWDFGDGKNGSGISPVHVYENPGDYTVTLVVTDNNGNSYSKSSLITIYSDVEAIASGQNQKIQTNNYTIIIVVSFLGILACIAFVFRHKINLFLLQRQERKIEKLRAKLKK